jgi:hypothetical protein
VSIIAYRKAFGTINILFYKSNKTLNRQQTVNPCSQRVALLIHPDKVLFDEWCADNGTNCPITIKFMFYLIMSKKNGLISDTCGVGRLTTTQVTKLVVWLLYDPTDPGSKGRPFFTYCVGTAFFSHVT